MNGIIFDVQTRETRIVEAPDIEMGDEPIELTDVEKLKVRTTATEDAITAIIDMMMGV